MTYTGVYPERSRRDGDGRRVQKSSGTLYWYGGGSDVLYETDLSGANGRDYIFFGGRRLARYDETPQTIYHYFEDHLGSSRVIVQSTTNTPCYDADFGPYGKEAVYTNTCAQNYKFTGKERDVETGNDNFGARYYENNLGRFTSADWSNDPSPIPYANFSDPQSLNLYGYVRNNPLMLADDDGHEIIYAAGLKNEQLVKDTVQAILADPHTSANLSGYVGKDNPDLTIKSDDLSRLDDPAHAPDGSPGASITQGQTLPNTQTSTITSNGVTLAPETELTSTTITIDDRTSKGDTPGVLVHESVHAGEARANPTKYSNDTIAEKKAFPNAHDLRPQEKRANAAQNAYTKEIKKAIKQLQKDRKKEKP